MRILTFSTLFPNSAMPDHGIFIAERLRHLLGTREVEAAVVAPVPWFPISHPAFGRYAQFARVPRSESFHGTPVIHPRYPVVPKVGMTSAPFLLALASLRAIKRSSTTIPEFDLIDAHYFYPDGVAAVMLGRWLSKPVVITARGTDLNVIPDYLLPRRMIVWAASRAAAIATVSDALGRILVELGVPEGKVRTLRNGVDLGLFRLLPSRDELRERLGVKGTCLLSVGRLVEMKGHHLVVRALAQLPQDTQLVIVGEGPWESQLEKTAREVGVGSRVHLVGRRTHAELVEYYNAADALVLASRSEGTANVLLESFACGTPVVATRVGGTPEVVNNEGVGELIDPGDSQSIADGVESLLERNPTREEVRRHAETFSWESTTRGQLDMFRTALGNMPR